MSVGATNPDGGFFPPAADDLGDGLAEDLRARVKAELEPGERLLWAARSSPPPPQIDLASFVWGAIALFLFFIGAVILAIGLQSPMLLGKGDPLPLGIMMDLASLGIAGWVIARVLAKRSERMRQAKACYAITDRRAISWTPEPKGDGVHVRSLRRGQIRGALRVERPDGSGSLEFLMSEACNDSYWTHEGFKYLPEVRRVEQLVRQELTAPEATA